LLKFDVHVPIIHESWPCPIWKCLEV
jgi:hypothetical protein